jgi:hypothetical protein
MHLFGISTLLKANYKYNNSLVIVINSLKKLMLLQNLNQKWLFEIFLETKNLNKTEIVKHLCE